MAELRLHFTLLTQPLTDTGDLCLGQFLRVPELTTLASSPDSAWQALTQLLEKVLPDFPPHQLWQRTLGELPLEAFTTALDIDPPRRTAGDWRKPARLHFHGVRWKRPDGRWIACVPILDVTVLADTAAHLDKELDRELRFAIQRTASADGQGITLKAVATLQRVERLAFETTSIALQLPSPKARVQAAGGEPARKSVLREAATDLTKPEPPQAYELGSIVEQMAEALSGRGARSILLVGASGVGKTAAVDELVRTRGARGLAGRPFWGTSGSRLVMGAIGYGAWQERCHKLCREAAATRAIIHLGNLIELLEVGKSESNSIGIAGQLRGSMARGELIAIAECTPEQLTLLEREDPHLLAAFRQMPLEEPASATVRIILKNVADELTAGNPRRGGKDVGQFAVLADGSLEEIERLHRRYASYSAFPGRPIRFLRNLIRDNQGREHAPGATLTAADVTEAFARETGLPRLLLSDDVALDVEDARRWFGSRVVAQDQAVDRVIDLLATVKAALNRPRRPIASLLFIGPTGVGKTEMAKTLAEFFFSDRARLVRFDMSEFATPLAVKRLIGGLGAGEGLLTARVREQPFSVVLLDELEKAHPSFFDLLLQILGDGRLTDAGGRVADFSNAVVIMTSNLGTDSFDKGAFGIGKGRKRDPDAHFVEEVRQFLRPELFNRIDRIIPFLPLSAEAIAGVARREIELISRRDGLRLRDIALDIAPAAIDRLAANGFDPAYGARPLKRTIERELLSPLADALNGYADGVPLEAAVTLKGSRLEVEVRAAHQRPAKVSESLGPHIAQRASILRRKMQRLARHGMVLQLQNELFQLHRQIERALRKGKMDHPSLPTWRERIKRLQGPGDELDKLRNDAIGIEEAALLAFYEQGAERPAPRDWLAEPTALEERLLALLTALHALRFARPDHITLALFSLTPARTLELARAYMAFAKRRRFDVQLAWYKQEARGIVRHRPGAAEQFFIDPDPKPFGIALEFHGPLAAPLLEYEAGWHVFKLQKDKTTCCQVVTGHSPAGATDAADPTLLLKGPDTTPRREFDLEKKTVADSQVPHDETWSNLDTLLRTLVEAAHQRRVLQPLEEEADA